MRCKFTESSLDLDNLTIEVNGKTIPVTISLSCERDPDSWTIANDQDFESEEQKTEYLDKIERGIIDIAVIGVHATALGIEESDYLGGCEVSGPESVDCYIKEHAMIETAIGYLKGSLETLAKKLGV